MPDDRLGIHVDPPLAAIPASLAAADVSVFQTVLRDPKRLSKDGVPDDEDQAAFVAASAGLWGIAHASMLTNVASTDPRIRNGSLGALVADANVAARLGIAGVCFHVGYQKGHATTDAALDEVVRKLTEGLPRLKEGARILLENGCEGTELGQTIAELGHVANGVGDGPSRLGLVLDTCHLHVSGFDLTVPDAPERLADEIERFGLVPYLTAVHLNDAQFPCGSKRDRHAAPGEGTIGDGLRRLLSHPLFTDVPAILELDADECVRGLAWLRSDS